jgi:hypothetical protein
MTDPGETASQASRWIELLSSSDSNRRAEGAAALYEAAYQLFTSAANAWMTDDEFRALVRSPDEAGAASEAMPAVVAGLAVNPVSFERIRAANGAPRMANVPPDQDAKEFELHVDIAKGCRANIDILTTREPGGAGAIARFLQKFGEGIQQIEIYVRDAERATQILRSRYGLSPIYPNTRAGADGTRVNFFLAQAANGKKVLIELVEATAEPGP